MRTTLEIVDTSRLVHMGLASFAIELASTMDKHTMPLRGPGKFHVRAYLGVDRTADVMVLTVRYSTPYRSNCWEKRWAVVYVKNKMHARVWGEVWPYAKALKNKQVQPQDLINDILTNAIREKERYIREREEKRGKWR